MYLPVVNIGLKLVLQKLKHVAKKLMFIFVLRWNKTIVLILDTQRDSSY